MNVLRCQHHDPVLTAKHNHLCCFIFYLCGKRLKKKKAAGGGSCTKIFWQVFLTFSPLYATQCCHFFLCPCAGIQSSPNVDFYLVLWAVQFS